MSDHIDLRREKLAQWRAQEQAFPNDVVRDDFAADIHAQRDALLASQQTVTVAGRMMMRRLMGKSEFCASAGYDRSYSIVCASG